MLLELGGKNALIAFPDADLDGVSAAVVDGMNFTWCGQSCGSTSRVFVHAKIYDAVRKNLYKESPEIAAMSAEEVDELRRQLGDIKVRGANPVRPVFTWHHCGLPKPIMHSPHITVPALAARAPPTVPTLRRRASRGTCPSANSSRYRLMRNKQ